MHRPTLYRSHPSSCFYSCSCYYHCSDDARANARKVLVCREGTFKELQWRDVRVGDVVKVPGSDEIPADLVFLAASCEDPDQRGVCHVQTAQLDGETNLKMRNALDKTVAVIVDDASAAAFKGKVVCEEPHENFAKFNGSLYLEAGAKRGYGLDANATLLRGCVVKNVTFVYGVAVYTGRETKVRVKQSATTAKKASVEAEINRYIVALVVTQLILCTIATIGYAVWNNTYGASAWYLQMPAISAGDVIARFFTFFLLISNIIPISLYVTMKLARELLDTQFSKREGQAFCRL
jgi:magnesium-transporting ATPase (P-type)